MPIAKPQGSDTLRRTPPPARAVRTLPEATREALYRAALGPWGTAYYLPRFAAMDASQHKPLGWHWAAGLCTLSWLAFRQLWNVALVYVALVETAAVLVWGLGSAWLQWPSPVLWGIVAALTLAAVVGPGLLGTAWLHRAVCQHIDQALAQTHSLPDALDWLQRRASSPRRGYTLLGIHLIAWAGLGLVAWATLSSPPPASASLRHAASGTAVNGKITASPQALERKAPVPAPVSEPLPVEAPMAPMLAPAPTPVVAVAPPTPDTPGAQAPTTAAALLSPAASAPIPAARAPLPTPKPSPAAREDRKPERKTPPPTASTPTRTAGSAPGFYLNVGLFAEEGNASRTVDRLRKAGLPAFHQTLVNRKGPRHRVRVGPYAGRAQSQAAAATVRGMGYEAQVFHQGE